MRDESPPRDHVCRVGLGAVDSKQIGAHLNTGMTFDNDTIDAAARARVTAFRAWLGVGDAQVLVDLATGLIRSQSDHPRRLEVAAWIADRRDAIRKAMEAWML